MAAFIFSLLLQSQSCIPPNVQVTNPYGTICLTKEQYKRLNHLK